MNVRTNEGLMSAGKVFVSASVSLSMVALFILVPWRVGVWQDRDLGWLNEGRSVPMPPAVEVFFHTLFGFFWMVGVFVVLALLVWGAWSLVSWVHHRLFG